MHQSDKEKKNQQMGAIISVGAHVVVFLLFLFIVAWRAPDPPLPEIGIELNFGLEEAGSGDVQPEPFTTPSESDTEEDAAPDGMEDVPEEIIEEQTPAETAEPVTTPTETVADATEVVENPVSTQDSPDVIKEKPTPEVKEEVKEPEVKKKEAPKLSPVLYPNNKSGAGGKDGDANTASKANQGDKSDAVGDQGDPEGTINAQALYGTVGGGGGGSKLQMSGWMWDNTPKPNDTSSESGKLVFQVVIDNKGNIERVKTIESSVSPTLEKLYKDEVMKLTFSKTSGNSAASSSVGIITFVIKAK